MELVHLITRLTIFLQVEASQCLQSLYMQVCDYCIADKFGGKYIWRIDYFFCLADFDLAASTPEVWLGTSVMA